MHYRGQQALTLTSDTTRFLPPSSQSTARSRRAQNRCWWYAATTWGDTCMIGERCIIGLHWA